MCFSSTASFSASAILAVIGVASIKKVHEPRQFIFAAIPLLFSFQQLTEGLLWLALTNPVYAGYEKTTTCIFLVFAQIIWPLYVPLAIYLIEEQPKRKKILLLLTYIGFIVFLIRIYWLSHYAAHSWVIEHHISYSVEHSNIITYYGAIFYFIATVIPSFVSSIKNMLYIGATVLSSFIFSQLFFSESVTSVWCFFAALISVSIYLIMRNLNISSKKPLPVTPVAEIIAKPV